jgi:hypothetical protein
LLAVDNLPTYIGEKDIAYLPSLIQWQEYPLGNEIWEFTQCSRMFNVIWKISPFDREHRVDNCQAKKDQKELLAARLERSVGKHSSEDSSLLAEDIVNL